MIYRRIPQESVRVHMTSELSSLIDSRSEDAAALLSDLIAFRSTVGNEREIQEYLASYVKSQGFQPQLVPMHPGIESDADYTTVPGHKGYEGRPNLVFTIPGTGGGKSIILNTHVDVVPAPDELFVPRIENGVVYGRGAVDAKGHVVTILLAIEALKAAGIRLKGDVIVQFVIEEEVGGNGALSVIMDGMRADGVVVLESSGLNVYPANRGAVWFKLAIEGKSTHMGRWKEGVNAILEAMDAVRVMKEYEARLRGESEGDPLFPDASANVVVNIGSIHGGQWPSMVAGDCVVEGGIGFLPNKRLADIRNEVRQAIEAGVSDWTREHYSLTFDRLHNEAYRMDPEHPLARTLYQSATAFYPQAELTGFTASCDARLFWHRGQMPTVVFGPGKFPHAHALDEQLSIESLVTASKILADFLVRWCDAETTD